MFLRSKLNNSLVANSNHFYFDYKNGKYGYNTNPNRGADTFVPFSKGWELVNTFTDTSTMATNLESGVYLVHLKSISGDGLGYLSISSRGNSGLFNSSNYIAKGSSTSSAKPFSNESPNIWFSLYGSGNITLTHDNYANKWSGEVYKMSIPDT